MIKRSEALRMRYKWAAAIPRAFWSSGSNGSVSRLMQAINSRFESDVIAPAPGDD
jgi:hypothetical protein